MNAADDRDVKLQRASADLLAEFSEKLPKVLWKSATNKDGVARPARVRRKVRWIDVNDTLIKLLEPFQEWPQLLDPYLADFVPTTISAFLDYLDLQIRQDSIEAGNGVLLPAAVSKIIYTFCKVRGEKIISRFLNNEPRYLEPILSAFEDWDGIGNLATVPSHGHPPPLMWEEKYVILLWLSHLLLAPFDLASMSSSDMKPDMDVPRLIVPADVPAIAQRIVIVGMRHLGAAGKERDSAKALLVRLAVRPDMYKIGLLDALVQWALSTLAEQSTTAGHKSIYNIVGTLSFLFGILNSAPKEAVGHLVLPIFRVAQKLSAADDEALAKEVKTSALARKMIIKIFRSTALFVLQPVTGQPHQITSEITDTILEDVVDFCLTSLADRDTSVRYAASKALSVVTLKLEATMAAEVVEAVVGSMYEDLLFKSPDSGKIIRGFELADTNQPGLSPDLTAVNPLRWHGLVLTLSHLLFYRSPPPQQLPSILSCLILALGFEQRSATGTSIGGNIRDAACFGIWATSRKYTTKELLDVDVSTIHVTNHYQASSSVLQILATELVVASCLDPSGNIRRGASAALQELVGRHPDTVIEGISLVQVVDYHAVSLRSRAITEVAVDATRLGEVYWDAILTSLKMWRGLGSPDTESRRISAVGIGLLNYVPAKDQTSTALGRTDVVLRSLLLERRRVPVRDVERRQGFLLGIASLVDSVGNALQNLKLGGQSSIPETSHRIFSQLYPIFDEGLSEKDLTSSVLRPELTAEAVCRLISAIYRSQAICEQQGFLSEVWGEVPEYFHDDSIERIRLCLSRSESVIVKNSSIACKDMFKVLSLDKKNKLVSAWCTQLKASQSNRLISTRTLGQISAIGTVFSTFPSDPSSQSREIIFKTLLDLARPPANIETRVAATDSLTDGVVSHLSSNLSFSGQDTEHVFEFLLESLNDYTIDRRGDVGSWVRLASLSTIKTAAREHLLEKDDHVRTLIAAVFRLAVEKLDKVRLVAWECLRQCNTRGLLGNEVKNFMPDPVDHAPWEGSRSVSSQEYFISLLPFYWKHEWLQNSLVEGYISSVGAGTESVLRASRAALATHLDTLKTQELAQICGTFVNVLAGNLKEDRIAIPALETLSWLFDIGIFDRLACVDAEDQKYNFRYLFIQVQKAHFKSTNTLKLEAAVKVYAGLIQLPETGVGSISTLRRDVMSKMVTMLVHPFPTIRNSVADALYIFTSYASMKSLDFNAPPKDLKPFMESMKLSLVS